MSEPDKLLLQKAEAVGPSTAKALQTEAARPATRRLEIVALAMALGVILLSFVVPLLAGKLGEKLESLDRWLPDLLNVAVSLSVFGFVRSRRFTAKTKINVGLIYQVMAALFMSLALYGGFVRAIDAWDEWYGNLGPGWVAVWMMFFAILVPVQPFKALIASLATGATVPVTVGVAAWSAGTSLFSPASFFVVWGLPYLVVAATAFFANSVLFGLSRDIQRQREIGSYQLEERLGAGGMGEVWRARHRMLARPAAIKLIRADAFEGGGASSTALSRFAEEAQATAELQSPHTVELYDFGVSEDGRLYYAMELLTGIDLESFVERFGPMPQERVVKVLIQACASLQEAHHHGLIHRDIKPANMVLTRFALESDFIKVLDFGLVKRKTDLSGKAAQLSQTGQITGTPAYLAPELALGEDADGRADLYALGCAAYFLLTGEPVFKEKSAMKMLVAHVTQEPVPLHERMVDPPLPELEELLMSCLAKDPNERPKSAAELAAKLKLLQLPDPWSQQRAERWWREQQRDATNAS